MRPGSRRVARTHRGNTHDAVRNEERRRRCILLRQRQELCRKLAHRAAVERYIFPDPVAIEDGKEQQRIFQRLPECFRLANQQTRSLRSRSGFRGCESFDMEERRYERDLQPYLLSTQCRSGGRGRNL